MGNFYFSVMCAHAKASSEDLLELSPIKMIYNDRVRQKLLEANMRARIA